MFRNISPDSVRSGKFGCPVLSGNSYAQSSRALQNGYSVTPAHCVKQGMPSWINVMLEFSRQVHILKISQSDPFICQGTFSSSKSEYDWDSDQKTVEFSYYLKKSVISVILAFLDEYSQIWSIKKDFGFIIQILVHFY